MGREKTHRRPVRPLDDELVLEHNEVALAGAVAQLVCQHGRERVDRRYRRSRDG